METMKELYEQFSELIKELGVNVYQQLSIDENLLELGDIGTIERMSQYKKIIEALKSIKVRFF